MKEHQDHLTLKWGTLKAWSFAASNAKAQELLARYYDLGASVSAMAQRDTPEQKEIICSLIDECNDPEGIYLDWDGKCVAKDEAKKYVREYDAGGK